MSAISIKQDLKPTTDAAKTSSANTVTEPVLAANEDNTHMKMIIERVAEQSQKVAKPAPTALQIKVAEFFKLVIPPFFGILLFLGIWTLLSHHQPILPGPISTWHSAVELFSHPFHQNSLDDQGIGWNILSSLERVCLGFGLAAIVGIPLGFMIGRYEFMSRMTAPVIGILRPVSPLAWLPLGLLVMGAADPARRPHFKYVLYGLKSKHSWHRKKCGANQFAFSHRPNRQKRRRAVFSYWSAKRYGWPRSRRHG